MAAGESLSDGPGGHVHAKSPDEVLLHTRGMCVEAADGFQGQSAVRKSLVGGDETSIWDMSDASKYCTDELQQCQGPDSTESAAGGQCAKRALPTA